MVELIQEFEAFDISPHVSDEGATALLTLLTDKGRVVIHMQRRVLEKLDYQTKNELSRVPPPSQRR